VNSKQYVKLKKIKSNEVSKMVCKCENSDRVAFTAHRECKECKKYTRHEYCILDCLHVKLRCTECKNEVIAHEINEK